MYGLELNVSGLRRELRTITGVCCVTTGLGFAIHLTGYVLRAAGVPYSIETVIISGICTLAIFISVAWASHCHKRECDRLNVENRSLQRKYEESTRGLRKIFQIFQKYRDKTTRSAHEKAHRDMYFACSIRDSATCSAECMYRGLQQDLKHLVQDFKNDPSPIHRHQINAVVVSPTGSGLYKVIARYLDAGLNGSETRGREVDIKLFQIDDIIPLSAVCSQDRRARIWANDAVTKEELDVSIFIASDDSAYAVAIRPIRAPIRSAQSKTRQNVMGFLIAYVLVPKPGTERVFCDRNGKVDRAVQQLMAATADTMCGRIERCMVGKPKKMIPIGGTDWAVDETIFSLVNALNEALLGQFHGL